MAPTTRSAANAIKRPATRPYEGLGATRVTLCETKEQYAPTVRKGAPYAVLAHLKRGTTPPPYVLNNYLRILRVCENRRWVEQTWANAFVVTSEGTEALAQFEARVAHPHPRPL
jgi:hypothetical protein